MREKLIELPVGDAILILKEELKQRTDGYATHLSCGGKGDPAEEVSLDALAMAISALDNQVSSSKWIPVSERLPEAGDYVLVCDTREDWYGLWEFSGAAWYDASYKPWGIDEVTHWMPLPEPPKEE